MDSQQNQSQNLRGAGGNSLPTSATRPRNELDEALDNFATRTDECRPGPGPEPATERVYGDEFLQNEPALSTQQNKIRQINIEQLNRGYIVRVGCQNFAFSTKAELIGKLTQYIDEPNKTEEKWNKGDLFFII